MIQTTRVWEFDASPSIYGYAIARDLRKKFGSKRSGTIYLVADNQGEAKEIIRDMFKQAGYASPTSPLVSPTHLVKQALRMVY